MLSQSYATERARPAAIASRARCSTISAAVTSTPTTGCSPPGAAADHVVVIAVGPHDTSSNDVYALLLAALDLEVPADERDKPSCCDTEGLPPADAGARYRDRRRGDANWTQSTMIRRDFLKPVLGRRRMASHADRTFSDRQRLCGSSTGSSTGWCGTSAYGGRQADTATARKCRSGVLCGMRRYHPTPPRTDYGSEGCGFDSRRAR